MNKTFIIAEVGNTHEGSLGLAKCFIKEAANCGVDAVKFQTHIFDAESTLEAPNPPYFKDETRKQYFERTAFNFEQYLELKRYCEEECNVEFISAAFSIEAVDLLEKVGVKTFKIPSGEVNNIPYLIRVAKTGKRVLLSSGMSSWSELDEAVETLKGHGAADITVLQCTSEYPCPPEQSGLNVLGEMRQRYGLDVGFSDHTLGTAVPIAAVLCGAKVIEKHFTLSTKMYGSDAMNSTNPDEFSQLVKQIRTAELALSSQVDKDQVQKELIHMKKIFEKSIVAAEHILKGTKLEPKHLAYKKPGDGIPAREFRSIIGKTVNSDILKDQKFSTSNFLS